MILLKVFDAWRFEDNGTTWTAVGYDADNQEVTFGGDWREMLALHDVVAEGNMAEVEVEEWQIIHTPPSGTVTRQPGEGETHEQGQ